MSSNNSSHPVRVLTPYEQNLIRRVGADQTSIESQLINEPDKPVEYLLGKAEFSGSFFEVTKDTLIPRVETEELLDYIVKDLETRQVVSSSDEALFVADLGTGCGAIGIGLMLKLQQKWPHQRWHLTMSDVSGAAAAVAEANASRLLTVHSTIEWSVIESDIWAAFAAAAKFDVVTANLPYIPHSRVPLLEASVLDFEPHLALDGGEDGLDLVRRFLDELPHHLTESGVAWMELDHTHTVQDLRRLNASLQYQHFKDQFGQPRFMRAHA